MALQYECKLCGDKGCWLDGDYCTTCGKWVCEDCGEWCYDAEETDVWEDYVPDEEYDDEEHDQWFCQTCLREDADD